MNNSEKKAFQWNRTKQLNWRAFLAAIFIPSAIGFTGFHFILPILVKKGIPVLAAYSTVASTMLGGLFIVTYILLKKESAEMKISLKERFCLKKLRGKEIILSLVIILITMSLTLAARPLTIKLVEILKINIPAYLPFFLDPQIDAATADPIILSSGADLSGRWGLFLLIPLTLTLNILTEEFYFRAWMLPKLSSFGKGSWLLNGLFFALYHSFQLWLFPEILIASLGFAFLNYRMKSVIPSLIAHILLNTMSVMALVPLFMS